MTAIQSGPRIRRKTARPTLRDVAGRCGLSIASVSRFLNAPETVSEANALRISQAILDTGFRIRRTPQTGTEEGARRIPRMILLLTLGQRSSRDLHGLPVFAGLFAGIQQRIQEVGSQVTHLHGGADDLTVAGLMDALRPDAVLLLASGHVPVMDAALLARLRAIPAVWVLREHCDPLFRLDRVFYHNEMVGRLAAEHLMGLGARRLAFVNAQPDHPAYQRRRVDFVAAVRAADLPVEVVETGTGGIQTLEDALAHLGRNLPDAIFLPSDTQVAAAHHHLRALGFHPGIQVRLMGCNQESVILDRLEPRPDSIDLNLVKVGWHAVEQAIHRFNLNPALRPQ